MGYTWPHCLVFQLPYVEIGSLSCFPPSSAVAVVSSFCIPIYMSHRMVPVWFCFIHDDLRISKGIPHVIPLWRGPRCGVWSYVLLEPLRSIICPQVPCPPKPKSRPTKTYKSPSQYPMVERCWEWSTCHFWKWSHGWKRSSSHGWKWSLWLKAIQFDWLKVSPPTIFFRYFTVYFRLLWNIIRLCTFVDTE